MAPCPQALRRPVIALRAFNIESVLIGDQVQSKEGPIMQIRFHWWRDAIDALFKGQGGAPKHPVVLAMGSSLFGQKQDGTVLPLVKKYNLKRILDTREYDLMDSQPPLSLEGLEAYAEGTASQVGGQSPNIKLPGSLDLTLSPLLVCRSCTFSYLLPGWQIKIQTMQPRTLAKPSASQRCSRARHTMQVTGGPIFHWICAQNIVCLR